jgi:hypothetical protein
MNARRFFRKQFCQETYEGSEDFDCATGCSAFAMAAGEDQGQETEGVSGLQCLNCLLEEKAHALSM